MIDIWRSGEGWIGLHSTDLFVEEFKAHCVAHTSSSFKNCLVWKYNAGSALRRHVRLYATLIAVHGAILLVQYKPAFYIR